MCRASGLQIMSGTVIFVAEANSTANCFGRIYLLIKAN